MRRDDDGCYRKKSCPKFTPWAQGASTPHGIWCLRLSVSPRAVHCPLGAIRHLLTSHKVVYHEDVFSSAWIIDIRVPVSTQASIKTPSVTTDLMFDSRFRHAVFPPKTAMLNFTAGISRTRRYANYRELPLSPRKTTRLASWKCMSQNGQNMLGSGVVRTCLSFRRYRRNRAMGPQIAEWK